MLRIGLIGCGNWAKIVAKEIKRHHSYKLASVVCNNRFDYDGKFVQLKHIKEAINPEINDCLYVASLPSTNVESVKLASKIKMPLIIEKPVADNYEDALVLKSLIDKKNLIVLPNLTNYFSESYKKIKYFVDTNFENINKIIIFEGGSGPYRKKIHPIWDWGYHPFSLIIQLFKNHKFSNFKLVELKKNLLKETKLVSRFNFNINNNINVKLVTGNEFRTKIRFLKIFLKNDQFFVCNMIDHKLYFNNDQIHKNNLSPLNCILNNFYSNIKNNDDRISKDLIDTSCKITDILEKFYSKNNN